MFLDPFEVLQNLPTRAGDKIGDFGAGQGTYAFALAEKLPDGSVYAFEALPGYVEAMSRRNAPNVFPMLSDLNAGIPLRDGLLDAGVVANTLHALTERERFIAELARVLRPQAPALVVDWVSSFNDMGPRPERIVSPNDAVRLFTDAGFTAGPMLPAGSHHYAFIATRR